MLKPKIFFPLNSKYTKPNNSELTESFKNSSISLLDWLGIDLLNGSTSLVLSQNGTYVNNHTPANPNNSIQYNNNEVFSGDAGFTRDPITKATNIYSDDGNINILSIGTANIMVRGADNSTGFEIQDSNESLLIHGLTVEVGDVETLGNTTKIVINDVLQLITLTNIPTYADDAAAISGGLIVGQLYKTTISHSTFLKIVP